MAHKDTAASCHLFKIFMLAVVEKAEIQNWSPYSIGAGKCHQNLIFKIVFVFVAANDTYALLVPLRL